MTIEISRPDPQLDLFNAGAELRDAGVSLAASAEDGRWHSGAVRLVRRVAKRELMITSDDVREEMRRVHFPEPPSKGAVGAAIRACVTLGYLEATEFQRPSKRPEAHAHRNPVWRATDAA